MGFNPALANWIKRSGLPAVNTSTLCKNFPKVFPSVEGIAQRAFDHFRSLEFRHFAFVGDTADDARISAFEKLLAINGLALHRAVLAESPVRWDGHTEHRVAADDSIRNFLENAPKPLAVLASYDAVGRVVCMVAERSGLRVPEDVAVLGINNLAEARTCFPPLSSIDTRLDELGYRAAEQLCRLLAGESIPSQTVISVGPVVARQSTIRKEPAHGEVDRWIQIIRDRACEGVSIETILDDLHVSRSTLERDISAALGRTPREEMVRARLERAKELLRTTSISVARISDMVGYEVASNFTAFFRKQTGITPTAFRNLPTSATTNHPQPDRIVPEFFI